MDSKKEWAELMCGGDGSSSQHSLVLVRAISAAAHLITEWRSVKKGMAMSY